MKASRSIASRLAAAFALASLVVFALVGIALAWELRRELERNQLAELDTKLTYTGQMVTRSVARERWQHLGEKITALTPEDGSTKFSITSTVPYFAYGSAIPAGMRTQSLVIPRAGQRPTVTLTVGIDPTRMQDTIARFQLALVALCSLGVALVAFLGHRIARAGLAPLGALTDEATALSPKNLAQRLDTTALPSELRELTGAFNGALDRLQNAYVHLEAFNADVAHELRTPLSNMIGATQVSLSKDRPIEELQEVLESNLEELERVRLIVNDMLFLARADQGETVQNRQRASVRGEIEKTLEFLEPIIDEAGVVVRIAGDAHAAIEVSLFHRAVTNLVQNAVQHTAPGQEIVVEVTHQSPVLRVAVANPGDPIPQHVLPRMFDRFFRAEASRQSDSGNHGLGLSIVKAIAQMHGGAVFAESSAGRTRVGFTVAESLGS